jgi:hypothetical protein
MDSELLHDPSSFTPGKEHRFPLYTTMCGPRRRSRRFGEDNLLTHTAIQTPDGPARSVVTILTELSRLIKPLQK